ncbi:MULTISPECIES: thiol:disulfide interchange protein DsbA/DsbL [Halomonas]|jgi:thiol:disulfide interchange protein DsbA|uniref:Thiol:disulfide interchange protein n=3 Tax=Halomonas TaxID=2745 RepID=A0AAU7KIR7_9GAMM|nr:MULTISPECIES: thiol:disulfide interchange protein DsbA/DsbL [Halomonas]MBR9771701.1 thiol:disulfide interchange protein DsbA/DsbL [Gammaproteobacteria bacterium]KJZ08797.1 DSBA oxidoreductase [Halomonas sp. S2151]MAR73143.1 disulfide bond formation protein DsbA [Halomonas sp.]MBR9880044.1 thiol:disulfide interchange protein DsbA/DsbL [Gammaproteobacteria bacterium]MBS8267667.1 thiol:disulfide interchange protein DsbA/DsbL [Halomonas litopenaei]|tara:strand:- start:1419 stop:2060 length:642 start_codon:yes stop_codon:yes gene_type:complete
MLKSLMMGLAGLSLSTMAVAASITEGEDYTVAPNQVELGSDDGKINVTEVFWYGCPHCYSLEDPLNAWVAELPDDVEFERMPATLGETWVKHAKAFYAAQQLEILDEVHEDFFDAIHQEGEQLTEPADIAAFFSDYGVSEEQALKALDGFGVKSQINRASATMRNLELMGVPALIVDGRYIVSPSTAGSLDNMPRIAEALVEQIRSEQESGAQ